MVYCGQCGAANPTANRFCGACGQSLQQLPPLAASSPPSKQRRSNRVYAIAGLIFIGAIIVSAILDPVTSSTAPSGGGSSSKRTGNSAAPHITAQQKHAATLFIALIYGADGQCTAAWTTVLKHAQSLDSTTASQDTPSGDTSLAAESCHAAANSIKAIPIPVGLKKDAVLLRYFKNDAAAENEARAKAGIALYEGLQSGANGTAAMTATKKDLTQAQNAHAAANVDLAGVAVVFGWSADNIAQIAPVVPTPLPSTGGD